MKVNYRVKKFFTTLFFASTISFIAKAQCDVSITPQGITTFCEGDSVMLIAHANGDSLQLDQSQTLYDAGTSARNLPGYAYWQSFTAGVTGTLAQIDAGFFTYINGTGYWTVWEGEGTSGTMLDSQAVNIYCNGGNCLLSFTENIPVTAGDVYTFQIRGGPGMPDPYGLQVSVNDPYANGEMAFVDPSGTYITTFDWVFNTWVQDGSISYLWSNGETDSSITVTEGGDYTVTATSTSGCTSSADAEITVNPLPQVSLAVESDTACVNDATLTLTGSPPGGIYSGSNVSGNEFAPSVPGDYTVYYTYTDSNACTNSASAEIIVLVCTGINSMSNSQLVSVTYGMNGEIIVKSNEGMSHAEFRLFNVFGEKIFEQKLTQQVTSLYPEVSRGIYLFEVNADHQVISSGKIVITK